MIAYYKTEKNFICPISEYEENCWVNVIAPTSEEIETLKTQFMLDPDYIMSSLDEEESSHIDYEDGNTFLIFDVPCVEMDEQNLIYNTMPVGVVVTPKNVITIAHKDNPVLMDFSQGVVKNVQTELKTRFVLTMLYRMAARFLQYLKQIDRYSGTLESKLRKTMKNKEMVQLLDLEKSLVYFQTSLKGNEATVQKITRGRYLRLYEEDKDLLDDVLIELNQAVEMSNIYKSIISGTMDSLSSLISNNLNVVMKVLTSITILMAIPTMIFSFFGMNIGAGISGSLPLATNMWFVSIFTVVATLVVGFILYKKDML